MFCLAQVYFWYPLNIITGGTTAKIMLAAKDNFLGKYIYKDTLARNLAAVIYKVINHQAPAPLLHSSHILNGHILLVCMATHLFLQKTLLVPIINN